MIQTALVAMICETSMFLKAAFRPLQACHCTLEYDEPSLAGFRYQSRLHGRDLEEQLPYLSLNLPTYCFKRVNPDTVSCNVARHYCALEPVNTNTPEAEAFRERSSLGLCERIWNKRGI